LVNYLTIPGQLSLPSFLGGISSTGLPGSGDVTAKA